MIAGISAAALAALAALQYFNVGGKKEQGGKPEVPPYDPLSSYGRTLQANIDLAPKAQEYANLTNQYNQDTLTTMLEGMFPGYRSILDNIASNVGSRVRGELPQSTLNQIRDRGAVWAQDSGAGAGSPVVDFRNLRNYSTDVMATQRQGESDAMAFTQFLRGTASPGLVDPTSFAINPATAASDQWNRDWLASQIAASPDPVARAQMLKEQNLLNQAMGIIAMTGAGAGGSTSSGSGRSVGGSAGPYRNTWNNESIDYTGLGFDPELYTQSYPGLG